ncbi:MAG TPA: hypothetical protein VN253_20255 [Kofleriaceae bacterium]|nr:hypothetical protein [Kofleriaceae bacterium]
MIKLTFSGWFECRLSTDPDPTDEPRGVSGWTYAVVGEPDFDRVIRTMPAEAVKRRPGQSIGVTVRRVELDGKEDVSHVLRGAPFVLLDGASFEGRNTLANPATEEPIFPFHLLIEKEGVRLRREYRDLQTGELRIQRAAGVLFDPAALAESGVGDPDTFVARRIGAIEALLGDPRAGLTSTQRIALEARRGQLQRRGNGPVPLPFGMKYHYVLEGPWVEVRDPQRKLKATVDLGPWIIDLWLGCWDADALCGYLKGTLIAPSTPNELARKD